MADKEFIVAIELGSSKVTGIAGQKKPDGSISVLAMVREDSSSFIRKGVVYNIDKTAQCLSGIVKKLEAQLQTRILQVFVGVGGQSLRSVRNSAITFINKERAHTDVNERIYTDESDATDPSETLQSNNLEATYQKVLATMPEKRREVFLASRFDGLKYTEIAEKMGLSQKTVEAHMSAAIKQLREGLKEYL